MERISHVLNQIEPFREEDGIPCTPCSAAGAMDISVITFPDFKTQYPEAFSAFQKYGKRFSVKEKKLNNFRKQPMGLARSRPQAVFWAQSTEEVSEVLKVCNEYKIPVVPWCAGTSLENNIEAIHGGLVLNTGRMRKILRCNVDDMDCVVQPGVNWQALNKAVAKHGLFFGSDPGGGGCIGGMVGTCCSGTNAVKYGTMKNQIINLTVVLADGTIFKTAQRARKSVAGYDLASIICGSEGTLGVVTEAVLRLRKIPDCLEVACVNFPSVHACCSCTIAILQKGIDVGAVELLDEVQVDACNKYSKTSMAVTPLLLIKFVGSRPTVDHDIQLVKKLSKKFGSTSFEFSKTELQRKKLWAARKNAYWAAMKAKPTRKCLTTDVAVPLSRLADIISETKADFEKSILYCPIVGHVGDGNFHSWIMYDPTDPKEVAEKERLYTGMMRRAIRMQGSISGEHGIGLGKKPYLREELGDAPIEVMKKIKQALDPNLILNRGKIFDI